MWYYLKMWQHVSFINDKRAKERWWYVVCNIVMCVEAKEWKHFSKQGIWGGIGHTRSGVSSLVLDEKQDQVILTTLLLCEL